MGRKNAPPSAASGAKKGLDRINQLRADFNEALTAPSCGSCAKTYNTTDGSAAVVTVAVTEDSRLTPEYYMIPVDTIFKESRRVRPGRASTDFKELEKVEFMMSAEFIFSNQAIEFEANPVRCFPRREGDHLRGVITGISQCACVLTRMIKDGRLKVPVDVSLEFLRTSSSSDDDGTSTKNRLLQKLAGTFKHSTAGAKKILQKNPLMDEDFSEPLSSPQSLDVEEAVELVVDYEKNFTDLLNEADTKFDDDEDDEAEKSPSVETDDSAPAKDAEDLESDFNGNILDSVLGCHSVHADFGKLKANIASLEQVAAQADSYASNVKESIDRIITAVELNDPYVMNKHTDRFNNDLTMLVECVVDKFKKLIVDHTALLYTDAALRHTVHVQRLAARNSALMSINSGLLDAVLPPPPEEQTLLEEEAFLTKVLDKFVPLCASVFHKPEGLMRKELERNIAISRKLLPPLPWPERLNKFAMNDHGDGKNLDEKLRRGENCVPFRTRVREKNTLDSAVLYYAGYQYWLYELFFITSYNLFLHMWRRSVQEDSDELEKRMTAFAVAFMDQVMKSSMAKWNFWLCYLNPWAEKIMFVLDGLFSEYAAHMNANRARKNRPLITVDQTTKCLKAIKGIITKKCGDSRNKAVYGNHGDPTAEYAYGFLNAADFVVCLNPDKLAKDSYAQAYTEIHEISEDYKKIGCKIPVPGKPINNPRLRRTKQNVKADLFSKRKNEHGRKRPADEADLGDEPTIEVVEEESTTVVRRKTSVVSAKRPKQSSSSEPPPGPPQRLNSGLESVDRTRQLLGNKKKQAAKSSARAGRKAAPPIPKTPRAPKSKKGGKKDTPKPPGKTKGKKKKKVQDEDDSSTSDEDADMPLSDLVDDDSSADMSDEEATDTDEA